MIICAGESLIDFVPQDHAAAHSLPDYRPVAGGSPFNCAIAAARLGGEVAFLGAVSRDFFGDQIVDRLSQNGVGRELVARVDRPTTLAFVKKERDGSARYAFYAIDSADRALDTAAAPASLAAGAILQIGSISLIANPESDAILRLAEHHRAAGLVVLDPNVRPSLIGDEADFRARIDRALAAAVVLKCSDEDLGWLFPDDEIEDAASRVLSAGVELVVVTRGAEGSTAFTGDDRIDVPAVATTVSDTIGAGDSLLAALLVWLDEHDVRRPDDLCRLDRGSLSEMLGFAARVAAVTCSRVGADPPWRGEVVFEHE